jgi:hypothetical protein
MSRFIYFFADSPHLIKTARNCFIQAHCKSVLQRPTVCSPHPSQADIGSYCSYVVQ